MFVCVIKSDDESDGKQDTEVDKEQDAATARVNSRGISTRMRHSASTKAAQNEHSSSQVTGGKKNSSELGHNRNVRSTPTVVQGSALLSDEDSAVRRSKRPKTAKK